MATLPLIKCLSATALFPTQCRAARGPVEQSVFLCWAALDAAKLYYPKLQPSRHFRQVPSLTPFLTREAKPKNRMITIFGQAAFERGVNWVPHGARWTPLM
jgi:hypothetical protein